MAPATDWKEIIPEGEADRFEKVAEELHGQQRAHAREGQASRALHAKAQVGLKAEFTVLPDLPQHARVGLFAVPSSYRAYVRFSNGAGVHQPDRKPDVRGIAVKLLGVEGRKIIPGLERARTQDFLAIRSAATPFRTADDLVWFAGAAASPATLLPRAISRYGLFPAIGLVRKLLKELGKPMVSLATTRYYSALPIKYGPYAVKFGLVPNAIASPGARADGAADYLLPELASRLSRDAVTYDFVIQFFVDEVRTPIEDPTVEWGEDVSPILRIGRLTIPPQDPSSPAGRRLTEECEKLSFDPWHATEDFRPLGAMMRARNAAYRVSTKERHAAPEPESSDTIS